MSEHSVSNTTESVIPVMSHRRILWIMLIVSVLGGLAGSFFVSRYFGFGVIIGGILSLVNYYWLKISLKRIFDSAVASGVKPRFLAVRYFYRYLMLGAVLIVVFLTKTIPIIAVILGLASFAVAIVIEGLIRLFSTFFKSREL